MSQRHLNLADGLPRQNKEKQQAKREPKVLALCDPKTKSNVNLDAKKNLFVRQMQPAILKI